MFFKKDKDYEVIDDFKKVKYRFNGRKLYKRVSDFNFVMVYKLSGTSPSYVVATKFQDEHVAKTASSIEQLMQILSGKPLDHETEIYSHKSTLQNGIRNRSLKMKASQIEKVLKLCGVKQPEFPRDKYPVWTIA